MNVRIALAVGWGLVLLTLASVWFGAVSPLVVKHLALRQMAGSAWVATALHGCSKVSAGLPAVLLCAYVLSCWAIFCVDHTHFHGLIHRIFGSQAQVHHDAGAKGDH